MIIAVDVDGTVADLHSVWLNRYNAEWHDDLRIDEITAWDMTKFVKPECNIHIFDYLLDDHLYDDVPPIEDSLRGVDLLRLAGHRVIFVTTGGDGAKARWLGANGFIEKRNFCYPDYVECSDKSLIRADVLIDDGAHNLRGFMGKRILFHQPWNANEYVDGAYRASDWREIPDVIKTIENEWSRFAMGSGGTP